MADDQQPESWFLTHWRPAMGWAYLAICLFDFIGAPLGTMVFFGVTGQAATYHPWHPLTLEGGGLFHVAMGAVVGVTSWSRGMEKIKAITSGNGDDHEDHDAK